MNNELLSEYIKNYRDKLRSKRITHLYPASNCYFGIFNHLIDLYVSFDMQQIFFYEKLNKFRNIYINIRNIFEQF